MFPLSFTWLFSVFFATLVSSDLGLDWDAADLVANHDVDFTWFREDKRDATSWEVLTSPVVQDPLFFNVGQDEFHGDVGIIVFPTSGTYLVQVATDGDPDSPWSYTIGIKPNPHATTKS
ncbi:hypothetical protein C8J56DRAFT_952482 [Mycena floridula]|nr:hypothetical protein C8J56DRAFT_952482 [Mycena floridula]